MPIALPRLHSQPFCTLSFIILYGCHVMKDKVDMPSKKSQKGYGQTHHHCSIQDKKGLKRTSFNGIPVLLKYTAHKYDRRINTCHGGIEYKNKECLIIPIANTVIYPQAVMIHFQNTPSANSTMMSPGRLVCKALVTFLLFCIIFGEFNIWGVGRRDVARVSENAGEEREEGERGKEREEERIQSARGTLQTEPILEEDEH